MECKRIPAIICFWLLSERTHTIIEWVRSNCCIGMSYPRQCGNRNAKPGHGLLLVCCCVHKGSNRIKPAAEPLPCRGGRPAVTDLTGSAGQARSPGRLEELNCSGHAVDSLNKSPSFLCKWDTELPTTFCCVWIVEFKNL